MDFRRRRVVRRNIPRRAVGSGLGPVAVGRGPAAAGAREAGRGRRLIVGRRRCAAAQLTRNGVGRRKTVLPSYVLVHCMSNN